MNRTNLYRVVAFSFIGLCIAFGQNCSNEYAFSDARFQKSQGTDIVFLDGMDDLSEVDKLPLNEPVDEPQAEYPVDALDPAPTEPVEVIVDIPAPVKEEPVEEVVDTNTPPAANEERGSFDRDPLDVVDEPKVARPSNPGKKAPIKNSEPNLEPGSANESNSSKIAKCGAFLDKIEGLSTQALIPGHTVIEGVRGSMQLASYEELSIIDQRGAINKGGNSGIGFAEHLREIRNRRAATELSVGTGALIQDNRGNLCLGVRDSVDSIQDGNGALIIIGTGSEPAIIKDLINHSGNVFLFNAKILNVTNHHGRIKVYGN